MRIACLSDLHLEFYTAEHLARGGGPVKPAHARMLAETADAVVLAGDIARGGFGVAWAARLFPTLPVVYVLGNHEAYGRDIDATLQECRGAARATPNVHVLADEAVTIGGVRFLGCTLWTDLAINGDPEEGARRVGRGLNDYRRIHRGGAALSPALTRQWHAASREWLRRRLSEGPAVVVTHHGPHVATQPPRFRPPDGDTALAPGFVSDCSELFGPRVPLW
mgnify:CR=1 FL=1